MSEFNVTFKETEAGGIKLVFSLPDNPAFQLVIDVEHGGYGLTDVVVMPGTARTFAATVRNDERCPDTGASWGTQWMHEEIVFGSDTWR